MDCCPTDRISAPCASSNADCSKDGKIHLVGTKFYCARHCPIHEAAPHLAIAEQPKPGVTEALDRELVGV